MQLKDVLSLYKGVFNTMEIYKPRYEKRMSRIIGVRLNEESFISIKDYFGTNFSSKIRKMILKEISSRGHDNNFGDNDG